MDFFQAQDNARKKSGRLVFFYLAAVVAIVVTIYAVVVFGHAYGSRDEYGEMHIVLWQPELFLGTAAITIAVIGLGSLFKTMSLRAGGGVVARSVGGQLVSPNTSDPQRRRLLNVVEEMSVAAGIRMPEVYVLPEEGINAFAAGYSPDDAAVAVSQGALNALTRDELQGVVAHEFSHILNGDMRLNIKLIGLLFGILLLTIIGRVVIRAGFMSGGRRSSKDKGGAGVAIALLGVALLIIGYLGVFFGRLIQAAVSRQREFLADASAVQFTRNPDGIAGALKKIGMAEGGSLIQNAHSTETSHMFFANALRSGFSGMFATHPPLAERIKAIEPSFDGDFATLKKSYDRRNFQHTPPSLQPEPARQSSRIPGLPPPLPSAIPAGTFLAGIFAASMPDSRHGAELLDAIPEPLREAAHDPERARAVLLALLYSTDNSAAAAKQDAAIGRALTPVERVVLIRSAALIATMPSYARLPLGDIALGSCRHLGAAEINALMIAVDEFIDADSETSLYEYALRQVLHRNLRPPGRPGILTKSCEPLAAEIALLLSAIAHAGASAPAAVQHAFEIGAASLGALKDSAAMRLQDTSDVKISDGLIKALKRIDSGTPMVKRDVLTALARAAGADGQIQPAEQDLLRSVAAALNCPAPVLV